eukprot:576952-Hanusia_phi.AAC.1
MGVTGGHQLNRVWKEVEGGRLGLAFSLVRPYSRKLRGWGGDALRLGSLAFREHFLGEALNTPGVGGAGLPARATGRRVSRHGPCLTGWLANCSLKGVG